MYKTNTLIVYDLLGEGEITLVNGLASIFLDKTPISNASTLSTVQSQTFTGSIFGGAMTVTSNSSYKNNEYRPVLFIGGAKSTTGSTTAGSGTVTVSTAGFFTSSMIASNTLATDGLYQKLRIKGADVLGRDYEGEITQVISGTQATVFPPIPNTVTNQTITFDHFTYGTIVPTTGTTYVINFESQPAVSSSSYTIIVGGSDIETNLTYNPNMNFKNVRVNYRSGTVNQRAITNMPGFTNASSGKVFGTEIKQHTDYYNQKLRSGSDTATAGSQAGSTIEILSGTDLPLETDRVVLSISVPNGLKSFKSKSNDTVSTGVTFQIWFDYKNIVTDPWSSELIFGPTDAQVNSAVSYIWANQTSPFNSNGDISGKEDQSSDFEFTFNIDQYKPFSFYRIRIKRITPVNYTWGNWQLTNSTILKYAQGFIDDKLSYPYSAYCALMLDANEHEGKLPERAYRVRGIRCQVPSNYVTREEASDGIASYNRNVTTGAITGSYQNWDGNFRDNVYCNNPVWILRTLLLDKRFGLGNWISTENINKFSFYSLARRCDELVPNGEGGLEPRFVCGVYIKEATEAYKIIKDFCSIMFSLPFWIDGKLLLEADRPKEPIYTFTKGNIIDGIFSYENTGVKTRANQIAVTFNDSKNFYDATVELVDDAENIINTGRIISEDSVAFGAVTRSQAIRYAKWKLLTSKYNTEVISFRTGENAGMLKPGDIIRVQDADRKRVKHSGRIKSSTTTQVTLDKTVTLSGSYTYKLHCMVEGDAIYLSQSQAVIQGSTYNFGDILPSSINQFSGTTNGLTNGYNEETSVRLIDDSGNNIKTTWAPNIHIETRTVTSSGTSNVITVSPGYSIAPKNDFIWALSAEQNNAVADTGGALYRIIGISEESIGSYSITAGLHLNEKFEELDELYLVSTPGQISYTEEIPGITDFSASLFYRTSSVADSNSSIRSIDIILNWTPPRTSGPSSTAATYPNLSKYKIDCITPTGESIQFEASPSANSFTITDVIVGRYEFIIRALGSAKNISAPARTSIQVRADNEIPATVKQAGSLSRGGRFSVSPTIEGKLIKASNNYTFTTPSGITVEIVNGVIV